VHPHLPQAQQTNQIIFAPLLPSSTAYTLLLTTGGGSIKICSYPLDPTPEILPDLTLLHTLHSHTSSCFALELARNGRYLATGGSDALICLWETTDLVCRRTLDKMAGSVRGLSISWDGAYVVGSTDEGTGLEIAHVETGEYVHTVSTTNPAPCLAWHPSRYWLAYSGDTGGLKIVGAAGGAL